MARSSITPQDAAAAHVAAFALARLAATGADPGDVIRALGTYRHPALITAVLARLVSTMALAVAEVAGVQIDVDRILLDMASKSLDAGQDRVN